ncbi:hypothetical protein E2121_13385 [Escherichia coli]|nr:hypothetical protein [Escherichia coli]EFN4064077.1 hypothetical protein [Escherichia coli]TEV93257.1 hypothetical protein E2121_13385 [Escherichia coli]
MSGLRTLSGSNHWGYAADVLAYDVLRLAGEVSIVLVLNDFQPLSILRIFCMRGFAPPPTYPP